MKGIISVFILLLANLTCYGINYGPNDFWSSINSNIGKHFRQIPTENNRLKSINQYWLFTRDNPFKGYQVMMNDNKSILSSNMRNIKDTTFLIHGWLGYYEDDLNVNLTSALLQNNDVNVICIDWSGYSKSTYMSSVISVPKVGSDAGDFINWLVTLGYSYDKMHIVGHSLGAHVAGYAGRKANEKVKRITGLDPAGPAWDTSNMLSSNDAQYVECIHTCAKLIGTDKLCGHADFFPNGGVLMPGCGLDLSCGHSRAYYYFAATTVFPEKFVGFKCKSVKDAMDCNCNGEQAVMGNNNLDKNVTGIYCLETKENYPFV